MLFTAHKNIRIDATTMNALEDLCNSCITKEISGVFGNINEQPMQSMIK